MSHTYKGGLGRVSGFYRCLGQYMYFSTCGWKSTAPKECRHRRADDSRPNSLSQLISFFSVVTVSMDDAKVWCTKCKEECHVWVCFFSQLVDNSICLIMIYVFNHIIFLHIKGTTFMKICTV